MRLVPSPKRCEVNEGYFDIKNATIREDEAAKGFLKNIADIMDMELCPTGSISVRLDGSDNESYKMDIKAEGIEICGGERGVFYAFSTLRQLMREYGEKIPCATIEDAPDFAMRGFYYDITRGRVPKLETLYKMVRMMADLKLNQLQLYVEHSFEYTGMEEIWGDKTPITREEIKSLDAYCRKNYIELIPSFSLFGHLYEILKSKKFAHLCEIEPKDTYSWIDRMEHHTIDITNPESLELIHSMIDDVVDLFSSDKFNICCDETLDLGKGKSKQYVESVGHGKAYVEFAGKIADYVRSKGKKVMMWGDIVLKYSECIPMLPEGITMLNWDYQYYPSEENIKKFKDAGVPQVVCPATTGWNRFLNNYELAYSNITKSAEYAKRHKALGMLTTDWGDYGHINIPEYSLPLVVLAADRSWNAESETPNADLSYVMGEPEESFDKLMEISKWTKYSIWEIARDIESVQNSCPPEWALKMGVEELKNACESLQGYMTELSGYSLGIRGTIILQRAAICFVEGTKDKELSEEIRKFVEEYVPLWRKDYKESELWRVEAFFEMLVDMVG